jgi:hypothetical protein
MLPAPLSVAPSGQLPALLLTLDALEWSPLRQAPTRAARGDDRQDYLARYLSTRCVHGNSRMRLANSYQTRRSAAGPSWLDPSHTGTGRFRTKCRALRGAAGRAGGTMLFSETITTRRAFRALHFGAPVIGATLTLAVASISAGALVARGDGQLPRGCTPARGLGASWSPDGVLRLRGAGDEEGLQLCFPSDEVYKDLPAAEALTDRQLRRVEAKIAKERRAAKEAHVAPDLVIPHPYTRGLSAAELSCRSPRAGTILPQPSGWKGWFHHSVLSWGAVAGDEWRAHVCRDANPGLK